ncbi:MAX gene-associated protein [Protopterus annectens]|uniref:MAX gene-associated protein n=1 Tax=Protopterus annectens TaxID=7888 RepID=UPI001CFC2411|nr:MAX gene-associated protein [Protopterus annectens]
MASEAMDNQVALPKQDTGTAPTSGTPPAFFVILKQAQGVNSTEQGILVASSDVHTASTGEVVEAKAKPKTGLPAQCISGNVTVTLDNNSMWNEFYMCSTEMILTKPGRRMFPYCRYRISGLDPFQKYILVMDITPVDNYRYKWTGRWWEATAKAEPHVLGRVFIHPESPSTGQFWMQHPVSFYKLKLTNNTLDQEGHIILHSMHRYLPRLHIVPASKAPEVIQLNGPSVLTFTFMQTEFFAVTAYQNIQITQLKIDYNPFAKGFRDDPLNNRLGKDGRQKPFMDHLEEDKTTDDDSLCKTTSISPRKISEDPGNSSKNSSGPSTPSCIVDSEPHIFNTEKDIVGLVNTNLDHSSLETKHHALPLGDATVTKLLESPSDSASPAVCEPVSVIKEEPPDNYDYSATLFTDTTVKQESTDDTSCSEDDPVLERQLRNHDSGKCVDSRHRSLKRSSSKPAGVAKAKMLKLESGKLPVVYIEPCSVTSSTVKLSELPESLISPKKKKDASKMSPLGCVETEETILTTEHEFSSSKDAVKDKEEKNFSVAVQHKSEGHNETSAPPVSTGDGKETLDHLLFAVAGWVKKKNVSEKVSVGLAQGSAGTVPKRGRPRKARYSRLGRPPKKLGMYTAVDFVDGAVPDTKPDLEDVDGVLFVSFASKEALDFHMVDHDQAPVHSTSVKSAPQPATPISAVARKEEERETDQEKIWLQEEELLENLKYLKHRQVIHPILQEVGLKLNCIDPGMSIDLKYLGIELPMPPPFWEITTSHTTSSPDVALPFISRTGKTNDFTKIKGWRAKLAQNNGPSTSKTDNCSVESSLKHRSAFCSDMLDEYLENEGKLVEENQPMPQKTATASVTYQLPTKSSSYVLTLETVLQKKPQTSQHTDVVRNQAVKLPSPSTKKSHLGKKLKVSRNKKVPHISQVKQKEVSTLKSPPVTSEKPEQPLQNTAVTQSIENIASLPLPMVDEGTFHKEVNLRAQAIQQQQQAQQRLLGLSKAQIKLMDLETLALWEGKQRTHITEDRADIALSTLLTAQGTLKAKPVHKIIKRRTPPCNNDFCRLGCICESLAQEKRQPAHCRRPECMFGCTCLKRKMVLVKSCFKSKKIHNKSTQGDLIHSSALEEEEDGEDEEKVKFMKKKKLEYTISEPVIVQPFRPVPLWVKSDMDDDPEPIYVPTPSVDDSSKLLPSNLLEPLPSSKSRSTPAGKSGRIYTPKPNPVVRDEDKDPVYLYFESMMTCARVRVYERKQEDVQPVLCTCNSIYCCRKGDLQHEMIKGNKTVEGWGKLNECTVDPEDDSSSSASEDESSCLLLPPVEGHIKLLDVIPLSHSDKFPSKVISIMSQVVPKSHLPAPETFRIGRFTIELTTRCERKGDRKMPFYASKLKISMPLCAGGMKETTTLHSTTVFRRVENFKLSQDEILGRLKEKCPGGKGLPFYSGLAPAGSLVANRRVCHAPPFSLIQVNGKTCQQAKLFLGRIGALHPSNRVAALITSHLQPTMSETSTLNAGIAKTLAQAATVVVTTQTTNSVTRPFCASRPVTVSASPVIPTAVLTSSVSSVLPLQSTTGIRQASSGLFTQFVINKVGALQQKLPGISTPQPVTGSQKFSIKQAPLLVVTPVTLSRASHSLTSASTGCSSMTPPVAALPVQVSSPSPQMLTESAHSTGNCSTPVSHNTAPSAGVIEQQGTEVKTSDRSLAGASGPVINCSDRNVDDDNAAAMVSCTSASTTTTTTTTTTSTFVTTTTTSSVTLASESVLSALTGQKQAEDSTTSDTQPRAAVPERRVGPRLLLIPVRTNSPAVQSAQQTQMAPGQRMVLQPIRCSNGANLFRHPNGQIIQLVPLHQLRPSGTQPSFQQLVIRNPGAPPSVQLPTPLSAKPSENLAFTTTAAVPTTFQSSAPLSSTVTLSTSSPAASNLKSRSGTLTMRISPSGISNVSSVQSAGEARVVTYNAAGQSGSPSGVLPLQTGSFALLQLPGQKVVPSAVVNHATMLYAAKGVQNGEDGEKSSISTLKVDDNSTCSILKTGKESTVSDRTQSTERPAVKLPDESVIANIREEQHTTSLLSRPAVKLPDEGIISNVSEEQHTASLLSQNESVAPGSSPAAAVSNDHSYTIEQRHHGISASPAKDATVIHCPSADSAMSVLDTAEDSLSPASKQAITAVSNFAVSERERFSDTRTNSSLGCSPQTKKCWSNGKTDFKQNLESFKLHSKGMSITEKISKVKLPRAMPVAPKYVLAKKREWEPGEIVDGIEEDIATVDITADEEEEKTDDSADELTDYPQSEIASDGQSEVEDVDVERLDESDSIDEDEDDDEHVDIETVEELTEKINIARLKARAVQVKRNKCLVHNPFPSREDEKTLKKSGISRRQNELEPFPRYREIHTANERRRRNEMRDLFDKLKKTLGLINLPKVSKFYILKQALEEIDNLTDQADKLLVQKSMLTRRRESLIRKVSILSGKTEEVVLKKLEYICAKQKAVEAQKRKLTSVPVNVELMQPSLVSEKCQISEVVSSLLPESTDSLVAGTVRWDKPLILRRKKSAGETPSSTEFPLAAPTALTFQLQGKSVQVKRLLSGPFTASSVPFVLVQSSSTPTPSTTVQTSESYPTHPGHEDAFVMPKIVNVTSLASENLAVTASIEGEGAEGSLDTTLKPVLEEQISTPLDEEAVEITSSEKCGKDYAIQHLERTITAADTLDMVNQNNAFKEVPKVMLSPTQTGTKAEADLIPLSIAKSTSVFQRRTTKALGDFVDSEESFSSLQTTEGEDGVSITEQVKKPTKDICLGISQELLTSIGDDDSTDETLTTLLNEIAFFNQQLDSDGPSLSTLPEPLPADFAEGENNVSLDLERIENSSSFQFEGMDFKEKSRNCVSPLLLELEEEELNLSRGQCQKPSSETDVLKIVIGTNKTDLSPVLVEEGNSSTSALPSLHVKGAPGPSSTEADISWRPMPKLALMGVKPAKSSSPLSCADQEPQPVLSLPPLAPSVLKSDVSNTDLN